MRLTCNPVLALVWVGFFLLLGFVSFKFAGHDHLTSFADDGGNYLIMAKSFSPYVDASALVEKASVHERYPPLFPAVLAYIGGAENVAVASHFVLIMFLTACVLLAVWASRVLKSQWLGLLACMAYVVSPNVWPMLLRILSENLYIVLTLLVLILAEPARKRGGYWISLVSLVLTLTILTRTIGITIIAAWFVYLLIDRSDSSVSLRAGLLSIAFPLSAAIAWTLASQAGESHLYNTEISWLISKVFTSPHPRQEAIGYFSGQATAMYESWLGALMLVWAPGINMRTAAASLLLLIVLSGWFIRLRRNCLDAWYSLFYLGVIFVWPFSGQFFRFILPLLPLFIVYAMQASQMYFGRLVKSSSLIMPFTVGLVFMALSLPAIIFIYQRHGFTTTHGLDYSSNPEFYQLADPHQAQDKARQHLLLMRDMEKIKTTMPPKAKIMWFTPVYINLLAEREGVELPHARGRRAMLDAIAENPPDYLYISCLHPRKTSENGLAMLAWVSGVGEIYWISRNPVDQSIFSIMIKLKRE